MLQATIPFDEIVAGATARLAVIENVQYLSSRDVLMHISGQNNKGASKIWERLSDVRKQELSTECRTWKFPGPGQVEQPVVSFKGVLKLVMWVGGENAKNYRSAMVKILQKYYAGDSSLLEEVETNAQSAGPIQQMARASLVAEALPVEDEALSLPFKKRKMELEMARLVAEVQAIQAASRAAELANLTTEREHMAGNGLEALGGPNCAKSANLF